MRKLPDIQELLRRHLYGTTSERLAILAAMSERVRAQAAEQRAEKARQRKEAAAALGLRHLQGGNRRQAEKAYAEALAAEADERRWTDVKEAHLRTADALDGAH